MKVFVAGASGVIGRPLVRRLVAAGHEVVGTTRSDAGIARLRALGAEPVRMNALDASEVSRAVAQALPDVLVLQLTNIPARLDPRQIDKQMESTNRLRMEATGHLIAAARAADVTRIVSQSIAFAYAPIARTPAVETDPLFLDAPARALSVIDAVASAERQILEADGIRGTVLRYGYLYGPGTGYARDGAIGEDVLHRRMPLPGGPTGVFSFIHVDDAAAATVAVLERDQPGIFNVVDDEPAELREWLPVYAELLGARPPRRAPRWLVPLAVGPYGKFLVLDQRGASNRKAREALGWTPRYSSWRDGFGAELATPRDPPPGRQGVHTMIHGDPDLAAAPGKGEAER